MDLIVPDTIEPVVGWKALRVNHEGTLFSPNQPFRWPPGHKAEAVCVTASYQWTARKGGPYTERINPRGPLPTGATTTTTSFNINPLPAVLYDEEDLDPKPHTELPAGMHWSWEPAFHTPASDNSCGCGIYMVTNPTHTIPYLKDDTVLVQINGWGNVIQGTQGARVQYAYPSLIIAPTHLLEQAEQAADKYKVPLQEWTPGTTQIDLTRTVRPTLSLTTHTANFTTSINQMSQAAALAQTQINQLGKTFQQLQPPRPQPGPSPFMAIAAIFFIGAGVNFAIGLILQDQWFNWSWMLMAALTFVCLLGDLLVFSAREKTARR